ncbi:glycosyltransferase family 4 protein [Burkholderia vietnamiensis]|uniref:glycosyltransferase family 4 protein n=1 Tax=Burkholderia vietnamiensis TaxID=60552 RepID=UPI0011B228C4|nr:glycosyltransferase family 4 protein [Burkholderia vietnamiensis]
MRKIVYFCPKINAPSGGVKVIHRHSEIINAIGGSSEIFYIRPKDDKVDWFVHDAVIRTHADFDSRLDFVILPETQIFDTWSGLKESGVEYAIFVQNGYLISESISFRDAQDCYAGAKFIICISDDAIRCVHQFFPAHTDKIIRVTYSVDGDLFKPSVKDKIITYMPRKMRPHSSIVVPILKEKLPSGWSIRAIDGLSEAEVAKALGESRIFLAFSDFEGLPVPPVEAAFAGNFVIGYTGQGGREYWNPPVFESVDSGDIVRFTDAVLKRISDIETYGMELNDSHTVMLRESFSREMERKLLQRMVETILE